MGSGRPRTPPTDGPPRTPPVGVIFGPAGVHVSRWDEPGWLGNTALPVIARAAIPVEQAVLIRSTAEQRQAILKELSK